MDKEMKQWIDNATYKQLLSRWRFAPDGDPIFYGEIGKYYAEAMNKKRDEVGNEEHVRTSKDVGLGN